MDAGLAKWGSVGGGLLVLTFTAVTLPGQTSDRSELLLGLGTAAVAYSILCLFGVLAARVHPAWHCGMALWRDRVGEIAGIGIGLGIAGASLCYLVMLRLLPAGMIIGALLVTSLTFAIICLGLCSTLADR